MPHFRPSELALSCDLVDELLDGQATRAALADRGEEVSGIQNYCGDCSVIPLLKHSNSN